MRKMLAWTGLTMGCVLWGSLVPAWAAPTVKEMLAYQPKQKGLHITTPAPEEERTCKVKSFENNRGYILTDGHDVPLRKFYDARGAKRVDTWSYFKDGIEVYRETDTNGDNIPDQFRWLNTAGMKWGVDLNGDGHIDRWVMISSEEVAEEVFLAVSENNPKRLEPLFIAENELKSLNLSAEKAALVRKAMQEAPARFAEAATAKEMRGKTQFVRVEAASPGCIPGEDLGADRDLGHHVSRSVLYQTTENKHDWLHTGSMVQVGVSWRLIQGPSTQMPDPVLLPHFGPRERKDVVESPLLQKLKKEVADLDTQFGSTPQGVIETPVAEKYNLARVQKVQQIIQVPDLKAEERDTWIKQLCDNLANAYIASTGRNQVLGTLGQYKDHLIQTKSPLAPYAVYRYVWATFAPQLQDQKNMSKIQQIQEKYNQELAKFVQTYPQAEDTPDALHQLGLGSEFAGQDEQAKRYYKTLADNFSSHHLAPKARGAIERLSLIGQPLRLSAKMLNTNNPFDIASLRGKVVVVYYWAHYCQGSIGDFAILKRLQATHGSKGFEVVLVNLDDTPDQALQFLRANPIAGTHLYDAPPQGATGMQSPLALQYGIMGLPTMFLVGRDGKVISRTLQATDLETNLKGSL